MKSIALVGLEKNTGKTETLNYILKNLDKRVGVTSIGFDGEIRDQLTFLSKPQIRIKKGTIFATAEKTYYQKKFSSDILSIENTLRTPIGKVIIANALEDGEIILAGPQKTKDLKYLIRKMENFGADIVLIDGALSRLSSASPSISETMILATGGSLSLNIDTIVKKTKFITDLIMLEKEENDKLANLPNGIYSIKDKIIKLPIKSLMGLEEMEKFQDIFEEFGKKLYISGALSETFINFLCKKNYIEEIEIIVQDFTKIFVNPETFSVFTHKGGKIKVLQKPKLLAVTINPFSPYGYEINTDILKNRLEDKINVPIINIRKEGRILQKLLK